MKRPDIGRELLIIALLLLPMLYLGFIWPSLPEIMPSNFNVAGVAERVGTKNDLLLLMGFLFLSNLALYALFRYLPRTDEVATGFNSGEEVRKQFYTIRFFIHIYLFIFTTGIIFMASQGHSFVIERWVFVGVGLLILILGNFLRRLQPNFFVGVRTPWTLGDAGIWRKTHQFAGALWLGAGIVTVIAGFFLPVVTGVFIIMFFGVILAALPYIYSFRLYNTDKG
jgi:hypothetical protein